jgi:tRNA A-37 threonylcarbamoyl transferase component Bud32
VEYEDYALRLLDDVGVGVAKTHGVVELTPNREYMLVTEFFEGAKTLGESEIDDTVIDEGLQLVRTMWDKGLAHRDIKPANLLVKDGHLQLVDVSGLEVRPTPWRQAVDLANMMLTLAAERSRPRLRARRPPVHAG